MVNPSRIAEKSVPLPVTTLKLFSPLLVKPTSSLSRSPPSVVTFIVVVVVMLIAEEAMVRFYRRLG
jgi:hypothetical protein